MTTTVAIIIALYIIGIVIAFFIMKDFSNTVERVWYSVFWPCTLILYCIHLIHNKW